MKIIDLRSDTVTLPTAAMLEAMATAPLGDDVLGDDPTVIKLEAMAAERMGKEAALLTPSGTMANLVGVLVHCGRGDEVILGDKAHTFVYEAGGISAYGGVHPHTVPNQPDGTIRLEDIEAAIRPGNIHFPKTKLILLENTHNKCRGAVLRPDYLDAVGELAKKYGLAFHIDGARIFNAAVALGCDVRDLTRSCDSVSFCLSKGLSCPVGSLVCGSREFIDKARRIRKGLGGGMRQAGVIAAAGIVALETMIDRLTGDHENARLLAEGLSKIDGIRIDLDAVQTNMVYMSLDEDCISDDQFLARAQENGVKFLSLAARNFRLVTHAGIARSDIETAVQIIEDALK
jgi:threonine aldolase